MPNTYQPKSNNDDQVITTIQSRFLSKFAVATLAIFYSLWDAVSPLSGKWEKFARRRSGDGDMARWEQKQRGRVGMEG